jgi:hypothetical protein
MEKKEAGRRGEAEREVRGERWARVGEYGVQVIKAKRMRARETGFTFYHIW